jgi:hypothetical protein
VTEGEERKGEEKEKDMKMENGKGKMENGKGNGKRETNGTGWDGTERNGR